MSIKTVLITGSTGLLGQQILKKLIEEQYKVFAVKRIDSPLPMQSDLINWITVNSLEDDLFAKIACKVDFVIHAAAMVSYRKSDKQRIFQVNTKWTQQLAKGALQAKVKKFVFISSISALGKDSQKHIIDENTKTAAGEFITNYGKSKKRAEEILRKLSAKGLNTIILNPSVIIGPSKRYQSSAQLLAYVSDQKPFYTGGLINYVDARDVAEIVIGSLNHKVQNEQFILNAGTVSYFQFFKIVAHKLGVKTPKIKVPKFMVLVGAIIENILSSIVRKPATLTTETAKMAGNTYIYRSEKVQSHFDIRFRPLEESIDWAVNQMQKTGEL